MQRQREWHCPFQDMVNAPLPSMNRLACDAVRSMIREVFVERATCGKVGHGYHIVAHCRPGASRSWLYASCGRGYFRDDPWWHLAEGYTFDMPQFVLTPRLGRD